MLARRPSVAWKYIAQIEESCRGKGPNAGHKAIQRLATSGQFEVWILTQNVDGFHTAAGSDNVIEIHGNVHGLQCTLCSYKENVTTYEGLSYNRIGSFDESIFPRCCTEYQTHTVYKCCTILGRSEAPLMNLKVVPGAQHMSKSWYGKDVCWHDS